MPAHGLLPADSSKKVAQDVESNRGKIKDAQKRFRQKTKQKYDSLEQEVRDMAGQLRSLERQRAELQAQIQELLPRASSLPQLRLPDIEKIEPPFMPAVSWANFHPAVGGIVLRAIYPQPRLLTRQQAVTMPIEDLLVIMLEYLTKGGQMLIAHSEEDLNDSSTQPGAKIKELMMERSGLCCMIACWSPSRMMQLQDRGFQTQPSSSACSPPDATLVLKKLGLQPAQKQALHTAGARFAEGMQAVFSEREVLRGMLESISVDRSGHERVSQMEALKFSHVVRQLHDNVDAAFIHRSVLWATVSYMEDKLTWRQELVWWMEMYPRFPDPYQLYLEIDKEMEHLGSSPAQREPAKPPPLGIQTGGEGQEEAPYVDTIEKMMDTFEHLGLWNLIGGEELASSLSRKQS